MLPESMGPKTNKLLEEILGYVNFSSGSFDPKFHLALNELFAEISREPDDGTTNPPGAAAGKAARTESSAPIPTWRVLAATVQYGVERFRGSSDAFRNVEQAGAVVNLVFEHVLPGYRQFHRDLLFHQSDEALFRPFFIGRVFETVLAIGPPWDHPEAVARAAIARLNDFVGHRPVAILETRQKAQPYPHEFVRPIPLALQSRHVAVGRYRELIESALSILRETDSALLRRAWFDPDLLDELALDPRAYDFDHPVNRRPNYHFGQWDPHHIDQRGFYRRFVLQQTTLDAMLARVGTTEGISREELLFEAAAVLAGTILMASGVSGNGPDTHDSETNLARLLPQIAAYRDEFYDQLLTRTKGAQATRLREEAVRLRQPFGGARQHLNHELARRRATQLQVVHLAEVYARMGYADAAIDKARQVAVAAARMRSGIHCRITTGHLQIDRGQITEAAQLVEEIEDLLHRAIECGALIDPWNILGFSANFSLFPAPENSVHDHRADELIELVSEVFSLLSRLEKEAAATGATQVQEQLAGRLEKMAQWWDQFATTEVGEVEGFSGRETCESANNVAQAVGAWKRAGSAAGDVGFWRDRVEGFRSPKAYALVVETLLEHRDPVASMALLMQWISQTDEIELAEGGYSFHDLATQWMDAIWQPEEAPADETSMPASRRWELTQKFFDYLEAGAESLWEAPRLELLEAGDETAAPEDEDEPERGGLYSAAYENVSYRDSTDDGEDADMLQGGAANDDFELGQELERLAPHLDFLQTVAQLWKTVATVGIDDTRAQAKRRESVACWLDQSTANSEGLRRLLDAVHRCPIPVPDTTRDSLLEYDRRQGIKENLLERVIQTALAVNEARRLMAATLGQAQAGTKPRRWEVDGLKVLAALVRGDTGLVKAHWKPLNAALRRTPLLYVSTMRGGNAQRVFAARDLQQYLQDLLTLLPRLGMLNETFQLLGTIQAMERSHPVGPGAITEYDMLFEIGYKSVVRCLVESSDSWDDLPQEDVSANGTTSDAELVDLLERVTEPMLYRWLVHSRNIRLSVLETLSNQKRWKEIRQFIERYGGDLFRQDFLNYANLRAILHQGVDAWLDWLQQRPDAEEEFPLVAELDHGLSRENAERWLTAILEAIVENYSEYMDYNSTTTQSDRGEMLYTLLDFLRILADYQRVTWNLQPLIQAHEVLVRMGSIEAAELWRQAIAQRTAEMAEEYLQRFERLVAEYGMRLSSIGDRLAERFTRPLAIDRIAALVAPSVDELAQGRPPESFRQLQREVDTLLREPAGVGFDLPTWLEALGEEVDRVRYQAGQQLGPIEGHTQISQVRLGKEEIRAQIKGWQGSRSFRRR